MMFLFVRIIDAALQRWVRIGVSLHCFPKLRERSGKRSEFGTARKKNKSGNLNVGESKCTKLHGNPAIRVEMNEKKGCLLAGAKKRQWSQTNGSWGEE